MGRAHRSFSSSRSKVRSHKKQVKLQSKKLKKEEHAKHVIIEDANLLSREQLKKLSKQPTNNIRVSGKRKRKMLKRLKHSMKEKSQMEVEVSQGGSKTENNDDDDVGMEDDDDEADDALT